MGEKQKIVAESLLRAAASFGFVAASIAVLYMVLAGTPPTSDDPYILGIAIGAVAGGLLVIELLSEQFLGKIRGRWIYGGLYGLLLIFWWFAYRNAELFGPGLTLMIIGGAMIFALLEILLLRPIRLLYYGSIGSALAVITLALLLASQP